MPDTIPPGFAPFAIDGQFNDMLGILYAKPDGDGMIWGFAADGRYSNPNGVVHGGMLMTFADTAMGQLAEDASGKLTATISLNVEFLSSTPVENQWIECRPSITRLARTVAFLRSEISSAGTLLMVAQGVWRVFDKPSPRVNR